MRSLLFIFAFITATAFIKPNTATLTPSCTTCSTGAIYFTGTGYPIKKAIYVRVDRPDGTSGGFYAGGVDASGNISFSVSYVVSGDYTFTTYYRHGNGNVELASTSLTIQ